MSVRDMHPTPTSRRPFRGGLRRPPPVLGDAEQDRHVQQPRAKTADIKDLCWHDMTLAR